MQLVTGRTGEPHITSQQDRQKNQGIFGDGTYILRTGNKLAASAVNSNTIQILDGALTAQGAIMSVPVGTSDTVSIENGSQGMLRTDVIVARYQFDASDNVESADWYVYTGEPSASNPVAPLINQGNIQAYDPIADFPVFRVNLNGVNIESVETIPPLSRSFPDMEDYEAKLSSESVLVNTGDQKELQVSFDQGFTVPPVVVAVPYTSTGGAVECAVKNITNSGFTAIIKNSGPAAYYKLYYVAISTNVAGQ